MITIHDIIVGERTGGAERLREPTERIFVVNVEPLPRQEKRPHDRLLIAEKFYLLLDHPIDHAAMKATVGRLATTRTAFHHLRKVMTLVMTLRSLRHLLRTLKHLPPVLRDVSECLLEAVGVRLVAGHFANADAHDLVGMFSCYPPVDLRVLLAGVTHQDELPLRESLEDAGDGRSLVLGR